MPGGKMQRIVVLLIYGIPVGYALLFQIHPVTPFIGMCAAFVVIVCSWFTVIALNK